MGAAGLSGSGRRHRQGYAQFKAGRARPIEEAFEELREKHGLRSHRRTRSFRSRCASSSGRKPPYGRIVKTIYILRYIHEEPLRRGIQLQLNRGEHRHTLAKRLFFANRGEFRDADVNEIMNKTSCLSLLSNAAVIWNTIHMQRIVDQLRAPGQPVKDEDLARNWPLLYAHIIPNGMYDFSSC